MLAGMKSEWVAGFVSESMAGFIGIRTLSCSERFALTVDIVLLHDTPFYLTWNNELLSNQCVIQPPTK
jgi:hypothetical protein